MSKDTNISIEDLIETAGLYLEEDALDFIFRAYEFAENAHKDQFRKSGEAYIVHPIQVAGILTNFRMDHETIAGGLLHDVVEDTEISLEKIEEEFNAEVAMLVDGVTKLGKFEFKSKEALQAENHRKMFVAMAKDIRVIIIKLADRLHNMRTLKHLRPDKQRRISNETLEIFAPLAHRLGMSTIKWELEDTAFRYLNPQQYYRIVQLMDQKRNQRESYIEEVMFEVDEQLKEVNIEAEISGRPKHIYSTYRKMKNQHIEFSEIYDLLAVRVIVKSIKDCYAVLGIIHTCWKPMPGRFKDYIAMPKPNLYQSLHTTVIGPKGDPLEVQIRTEEMHQIAERGIAAHWIYKEGNKPHTSPSSLEKQLSWFSDILDWQKDEPDAEEFVESLKVDLFSDMVYVFTPKGEVIELPSGSIPLDFAYRIHTEIGNKTVGARVNGKMEPLDYKLVSGDIVEVITSKHSYGPSQDWLKITQSSQAKSKIRNYFKRQKREENIERGKLEIEKGIKALKLSPKEVLTEENINRVCEKFNFGSLDDLYAAVGYQGITSSLIVTRLTDDIRRKQEQEEQYEETIEKTISEAKSYVRHGKDTAGVKVEGIDNILIRLARCCNPVPGDDIKGYITKGRGVSVHRSDCPNIQTEEAKQRRIDVKWLDEDEQTKEYYLDLEISGYDRHGLINDVLQTVNGMKTQIAEVKGRADKNKIAYIHITVLIKNKEHLREVINQIKQIEDIYAVTRTIH
ncbi:MAG TPA: bifunctional (p)ppGpp synthetase/guanosine-3',5'-bis(diphosphate) 3'-pyrophosphohydrolase [Bacillota bacterium]|nr:bifunctional (p)ppGpp synthetase/guanosine-3',5'-bis(diphosphate) 3'-pyrophosphohydrolase [Pseudogracilibacillus sp.]HLS35491.1 bifunctional (p)ppGpp synthetase/guanosine-3',5'-bis(diphosphate) 3'-pyrophosphohydrolase [Bacillota bacterium]